MIGACNVRVISVHPKAEFKIGTLHVDVLLLFLLQNPSNPPISESSQAAISLGPCILSNDVDHRSQERRDDIISICGIRIMDGIMVIVTDLVYELLGFLAYLIREFSDYMEHVNRILGPRLEEWVLFGNVATLMDKRKCDRLNNRISLTQILTEIRSSGAVVQLSRLCWQLHRVVRVNA